jgi:hypothetical protein
MYEKIAAIAKNYNRKIFLLSHEYYYDESSTYRNITCQILYV